MSGARERGSRRWFRWCLDAQRCLQSDGEDGAHYARETMRDLLRGAEADLGDGAPDPFLFGQLRALCAEWAREDAAARRARLGALAQAHRRALFESGGGEARAARPFDPKTKAAGG